VNLPQFSSAIHLSRLPWIWSFIGALVVWIGAMLFTGGAGGGEMVTAALSFAVFGVIVGMGQMFVITLGPGNIDLSIPANIGLAGAVAMKLMDGSNAMIVPALVAAIVAGLAVGLVNYAVIWILRIPPIIATLSTSFLIQSVTITYGRGLQIKPPPAFADFTSAQVWGIPVLAIAALVLSIGVAILLDRTVFGRTVAAIGQNRRAAWLAGLPTQRTRFLTYLLCGAFAGVAGALLGGFSGGATIDMGAEYLLTSMAVVVIGGTSVAGGRANVPGIWGAAIFLFLLVAMLNTYGLGSGIRLVLTGTIIIAVIVLAGGEKVER
jgi:ribose transport system permease protein